MKQSRLLRVVFFAAFLALLCPSQKLHADTGYDAWLRYAPLTETERAKYASLPATVTVLSGSALLRTAQTELNRGVRGMLGRTLRVEKGSPRESSFILGTLAELHSIAPDLRPPKNLASDGYWLASATFHGQECIIVAGSTERGTLSGVFALLRKITFAEDLSHLKEAQEPTNPVRWVNEWDTPMGVSSAATAAVPFSSRMETSARTSRAPATTHDCWHRWASMHASSTM